MKTLENYANFNQNFDTRPSLVTVYANHSHKFNKFSLPNWIISFLTSFWTMEWEEGERAVAKEVFM